MPRIWDDVIPETERAIFDEGGYGRLGGGGQRPALLVVDVTHAFVGDRPEPVLQSIRRFPNSCGEIGWQAMEHIQRLLATCRACAVPVFYTKAVDRPTATTRGLWRWKKSPAVEQPARVNPIDNEIPEAIAPRPGETVIKKTKPSAFVGTPLTSYLVHLGVDTLLVTGTTTSGCVRATVLDAFSLNFRSLVVEEAVFDRGQTSHKVSLFDMNAKYADVIGVADAERYVRALRPALATG